MSTSLSVRPELETLESREVPAVLFASYADGTWAHNEDNDSWRKISQSQPMAMDEGQDGVLFASYSDGTWRYDYEYNVWAKLTQHSTTVLSAPDVDNCVYASFSTGTFRWEGNVWTPTTAAVATKLAAVDDGEYFGVFGNGTFRWSVHSGVEDWTRVSQHKAIALDAVSNGVLFASFSDGTWRHNNGWSKLHTSVATIIDANFSTNAYWTSASGTFGWGSASGTGRLSYDQATTLRHEPYTGLFASFAGEASTWGYDEGLDWDVFLAATPLMLAR